MIQGRVLWEDDFEVSLNNMKNDVGSLEDSWALKQKEY